MSSTPIPPINPDPEPDLDLDSHRDNDLGDVPGTDPDLLDGDRDAAASDSVDLHVRDGKDPLDGAAVEFESALSEDADAADRSTKTITVIDATPETLGAEIQDAASPEAER